MIGAGIVGTVRVEQATAVQATVVNIAKTEIRTRVVRMAVDIARRKPEICSCSKYHTMEICIIKI